MRANAGMTCIQENTLSQLHVVVYNPLGPRRAVLADPAMIVAAGAAVRCAMTTAALGGSSSYSDGLRANIADHISERELSASLGFQRAAAPVSVDVPIASHQVSKLALGMGDACPFDSDELIYETRAPLLSAAECAAVRRVVLLQWRTRSIRRIDHRHAALLHGLQQAHLGTAQRASQQDTA